MGFKNSPAILQRLMDYVHKPSIGKGCFVYVDGILVYGRNAKDHNENLIKVLKLLVNVGLRGNQAKCEYTKKTIKFLGYKISKNVI